MLVLKMESVNKAGHLMSLAALQQHDPYINKLLDVTGQVALYKFNSKANEWEKTDIEGTLFVYARSASPHHGFTIMNRLSTENLVEPINKDLEFQLQDPFLLYRNASLGIYSIWFYDKADCQRIAQLMVQIVKQEALSAQQVSPNRGRANGCIETKPMDILELLSKAKEEYHRSQSTEIEMQINSDASRPPEPVKAESSKSTVISSPHEKAPHGVKKQITVEELFGSSLPKDPLPTAVAAHNSTDPAPGEGFLHGLTYVPPPLPLEPLLTPRLTVDPGGPGLVPILTAGGPRDPLHAAPPRPSVSDGVPVPQAPPRYVKPLKADGHGVAKPAAMPGFIPSSLFTPQNFRETTVKAAFTSHTTAGTQPMKAGLVVPGEEPSLLLSPSVFQQSSTKAAELARGPAPPPSPAPAELPSAAYNKTQLQDVLIHLIKHDAHFLSAIHEAYVQTLSKDLNNMKL
ncbi:mRNA-decapping enzyme 1A isoform X2 [Brachyhypopomus gauderio]|uniref:mRNA-decapping enzyme 1A isoform X2 n=1 Tax=Brachyhypopomus gauderio TaxID=698409 RepID=UPI0040417B95